MQLLHLNAKASSNFQSVARHVGSVRRNEHQDATCSLFRRAVALQRDHLDCNIAHAIRTSENNFLAVYFDSRVAFGLREAGVDEPKCNRVAANTEGTPLLCNSLGHTEDGRFGCGVVELPRVPVEAGC